MSEQENTAGKVLAAAAAVAVGAVLAAILLLGSLLSLLVGTSNASCATPGSAPSSEGGEWVATSYGPPWEGIQGTGVTATGIDLRPAKQAYIVAVDPSVIPLGSYVHVTPNPFKNNAITFLAADTGGAILGKHVDIYDWRGRASQLAWGQRKVTVTAAAAPGAGNLLEATPAPEATQATEGEPSRECSGEVEGPLPLTSSETANVLPDGLAAAPRNAPLAVKEMIAAGNALVGKPYQYGGAHGTPLSSVQPAYDCSSSVSFVLHAAGVFPSDYAEVSGELESYGAPGAGAWVTVYANSEHAFMYVAGLRFDTSFHGTDVGPNAGKSGPRWRVYDQVPDWAPWVVRHPTGL